MYRINSVYEIKSMVALRRGVFVSVLKEVRPYKKVCVK